MFSIVIPVWNKRRTLRRTVDTVLAQTFGGFELILVDDGSTDGSLDALAGPSDPRIRIVRLPARTGPGPARNAGVEAARHDWVAFLDADDLWLPFHLEELANLRSRFPDAGLVSTSYVNSDPLGRFVLPADGPARRERVCLFDRLGSGERTFWTSVVALPRSLHRELGGFGSFPRGEDNEFWTRVALSRPVARSTRVTAVYMHGTGGIMDSQEGRWRERDLRRTEDLSPAVALLLGHYPSLGDSARRGAERFIEAHLDWCLRFSVGCGDTEVLRRLPPLYRRRPPVLHRLVHRAAALPGPLGRRLCRAALALDSIRRRLRGGVRFTSSSARDEP